MQPGLTKSGPGSYYKLEVTKVRWSRSLVEPGHSENAAPRVRIYHKPAPGERMETARNRTSTESPGHGPTSTAHADSHGKRATGGLPKATIASEVIKHLTSAAEKSVSAQNALKKQKLVGMLTGKSFNRVKPGVFTFKSASEVASPALEPGFKVADAESLFKGVVKRGFIRTSDLREGIPVYTFK
jgi:hypothetical protein